MDGLSRLLAAWSVKDALRVLGEIDSRMSAIVTIRRLADDPQTDRLNTLHPLILRSRWLFGTEFESQEFCSSTTLQTIARELFKSAGAQFINECHRPDIVVFPDRTAWQMPGFEAFHRSDPTLTQLHQVLVIELKRGGFDLTRKEVNQADRCVQDIASSGAVAGKPCICAWVVGQTAAAGVEREKKLGNPEYGRVRATTFGALVDTAIARLLGLRTVLADRYEAHTTD